MFYRMLLHTVLISFLAAFLLLAGVACSGDPDSEETAAEVDSTAVATESEAAPETTPLPEVVLPPDAPENLAAKKREILAWYPQHAERAEYALKDVTKVIRFSDLGLGEQLEVVLPKGPTDGWPVGHSLRLKLDADMSALVFRFIVDTLPEPPVRGEGLLGLFAVHGDSVFGTDVELPRTQTGTGRFDIIWRFDRLMAQSNCCDLPPTFALGSFGNPGDTLTMLLTFDRSRTKYLTTVLGPINGRSYAGRNYCQFRTERGEYHKDQKEFPYMYECSDPNYVNLLLGSRWRGKKTSLEPVLRVRMF